MLKYLAFLMRMLLAEVFWSIIFDGLVLIKKKKKIRGLIEMESQSMSSCKDNNL